VKFLLAAAVMIGLLVPAPAQAEDRRPCVTTREWRGAWQHDADGYLTRPGYTRLELEARWDVKGLGFPVDTAIDPTAVGVDTAVIAVGYPRCGFPTQEAWYGASYRRRGPHYVVATNSHRVFG
jgi:hypothetical protein